MKFKLFLEKIVGSRVKLAFNSIFPIGKVNDVAKRLVWSYYSKNLQAFYIWKNIALKTKNTQAVQSLKLERLKEILRIIPRINIQTGINRIKASTSTIKDALKRIILGYKLNSKVKHAIQL